MMLSLVTSRVLRCLLVLFFLLSIDVPKDVSAQQSSACTSGLDCFDYGDAPSPYPTLKNAEGARHSVTETTLRIGGSVERELNGQPHALSLGDDVVGGGASDDEDGVTFGPLVIGSTGTVTVSITGSGYLNGWVDFNSDGDWSDSGEKIITNHSGGTAAHNFSVPSGISPTNNTHSRFRLANVTGQTFKQSAVDVTAAGEVEDHSVAILADPTDPLAIEKFADPPAALDGWEILYTVKMTNQSGSNVTDVHIEDTLPSELIFIEVTEISDNHNDGICPTTPTMGTPGGTIECIWDGATPNAGSEHVTFKVRVDLSVGAGMVQSIVNRALTTADGLPEFPVNHVLLIYGGCRADIVVAIDASGSMHTTNHPAGGTYLTFAKNAAKDLVDLLDAKMGAAGSLLPSKMAVVSFETTAVLEELLTSVASDVKDEIGAIASAGQGTSIGAGIAVAHVELTSVS